jgi:hypothetical protein
MHGECPLRAKWAAGQRENEWRKWVETTSSQTAAGRRPPANTGLSGAQNV